MAEAAPESSNQIEQIKTFIVENGSEFVLKLITAFLIFYIGKKVAGWLTGLSKKAMTKGKVDEALVLLMDRAVGEPCDEHYFSKDSINFEVINRLKQIADVAGNKDEDK